MQFSPTNWVGKSLRKLGEELLRRNGMEGTWIDVGAHNGEETLGYARHNPGLRIYAVEPNLKAAGRLMGRAPNYHVIPFAISETDGSAEFQLNEFEMASSLLSLNEEAVRTWTGIGSHKVRSKMIVPTVRLDTLMCLLGIQTVDYLKIDTQGMDLAVVRSAGDRISDIIKITLEVAVAPTPLYHGAPTKREVVHFLTETGFTLTREESQTYGQEQNLTFARNR